MNLDMLRMEDVYKYVMKCLPYLIPFIILLIAGIAVFVATRKVKVEKRKLWRSESWIAILLSLVLGVTGICFNPMYSSISLVFAKTEGMSEETAEKGKQLCEKIAEEGIVLLKNEDEVLPLAEKKINVFGWASTNPCYGGTGSGSVDTSSAITLLDGLKDAGFSLNDELTKFYTDYNTERITGSLSGNTDWTLPEPSADSYTSSMMDNAKKFSDTAVVVIARVGGEGEDLPKDMENANYNTTDEGAAHEGDFEAGQSYLELSKTEKDMVDLVCNNFENVVVIYNSANAFELGWVDEYENIKGVLNIAGPGQTGFEALGKVLSGEVNPSGHLADTYVYDLTETYNYNNIGDFKYDNVDEFKDVNGPEGTDYNTVSFVNYTEGIYIGYKFYETAAAEGLIKYEDVVQYPFGYGLSYTSFEQKITDLKTDDSGNVTVEVTVTNTGDKEGKDAVELYFTPPYTNGGIEKSEVNLLDFEKTESLKPGESQTISFEFNQDELASYDSKDKGCYVLESGEYNLSVRSDSHTVLDSKTLKIENEIVYDAENPRSSDDTAAQNVFDYAAGNVEYLSRKDHFANYEKATAAPADYSMPEEVKAKFLNNDNYNYEDYNNEADEMPATGADNGIKLAELRGLDYDDELWNQLLDELTVDDMVTMLGSAGFSTKEIKRIGKVETSEIDGPAGLHSFFNQNKQGSSYPASNLMACTWNKNLAEELGSQIGDEAAEIDVNGWYGPAMNIHRSAFSGRNYEYFSEDAVLSGRIAAQEVKAAQEKGVYCFLKHFALNDQETNRNNQLCVWVDEQAAREGYLKAFEYAVKDGKATAIMSAFNYIGTAWAGASSSLLNDVLRSEWGFRGTVLTDAALDGYNYINGDQAVRNGGDAILNPDFGGDTIIHDTESATSVIAMRNATHNVLYTVVNSNAYNEENSNAFGLMTWEKIYYGCLAVICILLLVAEIVTVRRYLKRKKQAQELQ